MQKPIAIISPLFHRGAEHIRVKIQNKSHPRSLLNQIKGRRWSATYRSWYVPKTEGSYKQLKELFEVEIKDKAVLNNLSKEEPSFIQNQSDEFIIVQYEHAYRVKVFIPRHRTDWITKIKSLPNRAWNMHEQYWSVPKTEAALAAMQERFGQYLKIEENIDWQPSFKNKQTTENLQFNHAFQQRTTTSEEQVENLNIRIPATVKIKEIGTGKYSTKIVYGDQIVLTQINEEWIGAFVPKDKKGWVALIQNIPGRMWHSEHQCWCLPYVKETQIFLKKHLSPAHIISDFSWSSEIPEAIKMPKRQVAETPLNQQLTEQQKRAILALEEKLILEGKRQRTIKTYKGQLRQFLLFYRNEKPSSITFEQINKYIVVRKKQDNISNSYLNQFINAINAFYVRVLKQEDKVAKVERPPKRKKLPNVFSEEEVQLLLKNCKNLKHKCLLILTYSGGLRKSEVLQLKIHDLSFDRKTIFIRNAKRGKDRYTFFSDVAMKHIQEYLEQYNPRVWLFEGQFGGNYSESSLQSIFEQAKDRCDVNPFVTLHGLRHSFATHLVEKGVPLHVVQELLGHGSIKTTEIYLHISNKYRKELKSPLDNMDIW